MGTKRPDEIKKLIEENHYNQIFDLINSGKIYFGALNRLVDSTYKNDLSNPDLSSLFENLWKTDTISSAKLESISPIFTKLINNPINLLPATKLLLQLLCVCGKDNHSRLTSIIASIHHIECAKCIIKKTSPENITELLSSLLPICIYKCNIHLISYIRNTYPETFENILNNLHHDMILKANKLLTLDNDIAIEIANIMSEFVDGFGKITYQGALLTCAQVSNNKLYPFNPTILKEDPKIIDYVSNFNAYFFILAAADKPIRDIFIMTSEDHWVSGEIYIDREGHASLLLIDPIGREDTVGKNNIYLRFNKYFPNNSIYTTIEARQYSRYGCSAFALDDINHLFTLEKYLDKKYEKTGIFGYLSDHIVNVEILDIPKKTEKITVNECKLPISLIRVTQSSRLFTELFPDRTDNEMKQIINKKGETAAISAQNEFINGINTRLSRKLSKNIAEKNAAYLLNNDLSTIREKMQTFTLEGLRKRIDESKGPSLPSKTI